ncbi:hypothetical protein M9458_015045, partial [Cirrhinus mrigala]
ADRQSSQCLCLYQPRFGMCFDLLYCTCLRHVMAPTQPPELITATLVMLVFTPAALRHVFRPPITHTSAARHGPLYCTVPQLIGASQ